VATRSAFSEWGGLAGHRCSATDLKGIGRIMRACGHRSRKARMYALAIHETDLEEFADFR
jgi:hypothetical protein